MTKDEFTYLFWLLFDSLEGEVTTALKEWWGDKKPLFVISDDDIHKFEERFGQWLPPRSVAATDGVIFLFDLSKLSMLKNPGMLQTSLTAVVYHEIAHAYLFAIGEFRMAELRFSDRLFPGASLKRIKCESRAMELERLWLRRLESDAALVARLQSDMLITKIGPQFCLSPL